MYDYLVQFFKVSNFLAFIYIALATIAVYFLSEALKRVTERYKSMQIVALFLYNRLENIEKLSEQKMQSEPDGETDWTAVYSITQRRFDVATQSYSGLVFKDLVTKETLS